MFQKLSNKIKNNFRVYQDDIATKGLYWSIIHRLYKIPNMRRVLTPVVNVLKPQSVMIQGHKLYIDKWDTTVSQELLLSGKWEEYETELFKKNIAAGDTVVDIGAHIGYYTLLAARLVGERGKVYAFEPDPRNFQLLKKNIEENGYNNVVLVNKAVAEISGKAQLFLNSENTGDHRIYQSNENRRSLVIATTTLDEYFKDKEQRIDLIKMDIQGSEARAFQGGKNIIDRNKQIKIITEFQPAFIKMSGRSAKEYLSLLRKSRFKLYQINEAENKLKLVSNDEKLLVQLRGNNAGA